MNPKYGGLWEIINDNLKPKTGMLNKKLKKCTQSLIIIIIMILLISTVEREVYIINKSSAQPSLDHSPSHSFQRDSRILINAGHWQPQPAAASFSLSRNS